MLAACTHASLVPSVSVGYTTILAVLWPFVNFTYFVNFIWFVNFLCFVNFPCFVVYVCFIAFFLLIKAFGLGRPVERYNHDLSPILQRYGPSRHPSLASINSIAIGKAMLLRTLLLALLNCARHSDDYRTSMAAQVEILALINQQLDGADDAALEPNDDNAAASELAHIRYPGADAHLLPRDTGHVACAAALQFYMNEITAISVHFYGDDSDPDAGRISKPSGSTPIWPDGLATWYMTGHAAKPSREESTRPLRSSRPPWLRQADLTDEATDDADVDWYQEYKQSAIMDKLPSLPRTDSCNPRRL
ncbi:hypothetical protein CNMCM6805_006563 [Aspergillus fumigatiaffinis]|uniref:Uncharacterized protein n=1 Tax=Aspergillus fumigatiaffinis TaxID=340414 RepID=A0A8H4HIT8_9EURO|nr:hypothetical protein CNMCM6805_006563 [Aspergillus fumigatiaffinis]